MREINFKNCIRYIRLIKETVDSSWLSEELRKIQSYKPPKKKRKLSFIDYAEKFHPLAFLIYQVDKQLKSCAVKEFFEVSEQILKLSKLGEDLAVLKSSNVKGLDDKIHDLISSDRELFDKTRYEIEVAAAYARKEYPPEFIKTKSKEGTKTPDIFIHFECGVEVECKKKDIKTDRDIQNTEYWKLIMRKASGIMEHCGLNYALFVKTQEDPTEDKVRFILDQLQALIAERKEGKFIYRDKGIGISLKILSEKDTQIESSGIQFGTSEEMDYLTQAMEVSTEGSKSFIRNPRIFGFKSVVLPDRITSVIESIKVARQQLSGKYPGLIYVNMNMIDRKMVDKDFERLNYMIKKILTNNSTISAVIITTEYFIKESKGYVYSHRAKVIKNEQPKQSLPTNFYIIGESKSYKN